MFNVKTGPLGARRPPTVASEKVPSVAYSKLGTEMLKDLGSGKYSR